MDTTRHAGQVVLVTGAGYGIGRATACRFALEGATVVGLDVSDEGLRLAADELAAAGAAVTLVKADITSQADVDRVVAETIAAHGRVDVLANVAGIMDSFLAAHDVDDATWERVMDVNVTGAMRLGRAVLPGMMERKAGCIVNVASVGGFRGGAAGVAYTTSKHAVIGYTRNVAWTYQTEGIRCNAVCPGGVETNIGTTAVPRAQWDIARLAKIHAAAERQAKPDEIAALISWLASAEASNVNGAIVTADGGWSAG
jgi:NAD(P)-dependent dehydrogenase (short-subunit alcohol dehydrogenase family)